MRCKGALVMLGWVVAAFLFSIVAYNWERMKLGADCERHTGTLQVLPDDVTGNKK